jgi:hypothetical protein
MPRPFLYGCPFGARELGALQRDLAFIDLPVNKSNFRRLVAESKQPNLEM